MRELTRDLSSVAERQVISASACHNLLRVYIEALIGFSHIYQPDSLSNTLLSQAVSLKMVLAVGTCGLKVHSKEGEGARSL